jgi:multicomponent Na+:H+ antiporter subunit B
VLADYRGYDTLGETVVIFTAGLACILILMKRKANDKATLSKHNSSDRM